MSGWHRLEPGAGLTRWAMTPAEELPFPGIARPMEDRVTYRFVNGWVDTGDLPCREALRRGIGRPPATRPEGPFAEVVQGFDGPELDFSTFRHRPTLIRRGLRCRVRGDGAVTFDLSTCGGVALWLDGQEVTRFEPFDRNTPHRTQVAMTLSGTHDLTLRLEDLHERDTTCFLSLILREGALEHALPEGMGSPQIEEVAAVLGSLRTEAVFHDDAPIRLRADPPPMAPVTLRITRPHAFARGGLSRDPAPLPEQTVTLTPETPTALLHEADPPDHGALALDIRAEAGGCTLRRSLGTTRLAQAAPLPGDLPARKAEALARIARGTGFEPSVALLLAQCGEQPQRVARILGAALTTIEERHDCSDFTILPLLWLWRTARGALAPALRDRLEAALLGYRYWLDEPGNDVMWFWSENHVLCFHVAQLLAGQAFPDRTFPNSGKTGTQHAAQAAARLHRWFDAIDEDGLCEWNSAAYYPIDLLGLLTLRDGAPEFRARVEDVLDRLFVMTALHTTGGVPAGTQGRCYEKELLAGPGTELGSVAAIAFGGAFAPGYDRASVLLCLSDYAPPPLCARLTAPEDGQVISARYTQGVGHAGKLSLWKTAQGQLSTVTGLPAGTKGHQAQVIDVQLAGHPMARLWINHPGERKPWGERRPSLLAGSHVVPQVAQHDGTALVIFDLARDWTDLPFAQVFAAPGAFAAPQAVGGWWVYRSGASQVAVWCSAPLEEVSGLYAGALRRAQGPRLGWVVTLPVPEETPDAFAARLARSVPVFDAEARALTTPGQRGEALRLSFDGTLTVGGAPQPFGPLTPEPHIALNAAPLTHWKALP